ncbi:class I SAM-dependent methyltransferase [Bacillus sp. 1NLA3E]|uniref:class I SAM-dependent methyltransferase n=1 Tax=Bacillus sp. 1NLA3E TaxID=666686 RepID=UPI000247F1B4|nr:class I SAM-dependent methyltransferase [Bacillus sp. 1NLA3E]AGK54043.1 hypothetical protein B1NLA3E_11455 [Bacillus sp. 1NLA3E]
MEKHQCNSNKIDRLANKIKFLDNPERKAALPPEKLLQHLPMKRSNHVLDLGAGTGYLTIPAAQMVDGIVYALDVDSHMLKAIDAKAHAENITNIQLVKGSIDDIPLSDDSIDIALASLVLHEVKPLSNTLQQVYRVLKEGGYFLVLEYEKTEGPTEGPPMHVRVPSSIMEQEMINAGFTIEQKIFLSDLLYILVVKK